jgi:hypothetical protein
MRAAAPLIWRMTRLCHGRTQRRALHEEHVRGLHPPVVLWIPIGPILRIPTIAQTLIGRVHVGRNRSLGMSNAIAGGHMLFARTVVQLQTEVCTLTKDLACVGVTSVLTSNSRDRSAGTLHSVLPVVRWKGFIIIIIVRRRSGF